MKLRTLTLLAAIALAFAFTATSVHAAGPGDGTCPSPGMTDSDGDGIPNGLDPDWVRPLDGTGNQYGRGVRPTALQGGETHQWRNAWSFGHLRAVAASFGFGPGTGTGVCDGTGPKGFGGFGKR